jgi:hypothetical protein
LSLTIKNIARRLNEINVVIVKEKFEEKIRVTEKNRLKKARERCMRWTAFENE